MEVLRVHVTGHLPLKVTPAMRVGRLQENAVHLAHESGQVDCTTVATSGMVAQASVRVATQAGVDQILMGTRGLNARRNHFLCSMAHQVLQLLASMPVLLVICKPVPRFPWPGTWADGTGRARTGSHRARAPGRCG